MRSLVKAVLTAMIIMSSAPAMGVGLNKIQEVHQITAFDNNGEDGKIYQTGKASYYGGNGHHGRKTASGKVFDKNGMTCAHMTLPFGTKLKVTNSKTGAFVIVTVTDRGNFGKLGRVIDLSEGAFKKIAPLKQGIVNVKIEKI